MHTTKITVTPLPNTATQTSTISNHVQHRRLPWIVFFISIAIVLIATATTLSLTLNSTHNNTVSTHGSIVDTTTINELFTATDEGLTMKRTYSTATITASKEQLLPCFIVDNNTKWQELPSIVAGSVNKGDGLDQLHEPLSVDIDNDDQSMYISDASNHRVMKWQFNALNGVVAAGGNGKGSEMNQLDYPTDAILYKQKHSLIICDNKNRRVVTWSRINVIDRQILISFIHCYALAMDRNEYLYVSDEEFNVVRRWKHGEAYGTKVAGGNGPGRLDRQLHSPRYIFVDQNGSVYVADYLNGRVMKWVKDAQEGAIVARARVETENSNTPHYVAGVIVDHMDNVYVSDIFNCEIVRWPPGALNSDTVANIYRCGRDDYTGVSLSDIAWDRQGNLYVVDTRNHRVQKFAVDHS